MLSHLLICKAHFCYLSYLLKSLCCMMSDCYFEYLIESIIYLLKRGWDYEVLDVITCIIATYIRVSIRQPILSHDC